MEIWNHGANSQKESKSDVTKYRPVTLLDSVSKVFEKTLFTNILDHLISHNLVYPLQFGFLPGKSTSSQLVEIVHEIHLEFQKNNNVRSIFLDIASAFDTVPHDLLVVKLKSYGLSAKVLNLLESYLKNRSYQVKIDGTLASTSHPGFVNAGVPQGSVLGPLLFLIYINDLPDNLLAKTFLYADDTAIFLPFPKNDLNQSMFLQNDLNILNNWACTWRMNFKAEKSVDLIFSSSPNNHSIIDPLWELSLNGQIIPHKTSHKHLGVILDNRLSFNLHCRELANKVQKLINPLRYLSKFMNSSHLLTIYNSFIQPHFDYADIIYHSANSLHLQTLEKLQYHAALSISGATKGSNKIKVFNTLNWPTLTNRRHQHLLFYTFKVLNEVNNVSNKKYFDIYKRNIQRDNLRNTTEFSIPTTYSQAFRKTTIITCIDLWTKADRSLKSCRSISMFKKQLNSSLYTSNVMVSSTVSDQIPREHEILINKLRSDLLLRSQKFRHNFADTSPNCDCGEIQTISHVFFKCRLNDVARNEVDKFITDNVKIKELFNSFTKLSDKANFLINGAACLNKETNLKILKSAAAFLFSSKLLFT